MQKKTLVPSDRDRFSYNHFNTMRLAMALLVVWSHSFALYLGTEDHEPISLLLNGKYNAGNIGVRVFFAISGLLIVSSFERTRSILTYFGKRILRIYPGYLVAVAFCAFIVVPVFSSNGGNVLTPSIAIEWVWQNLLLRNFIPASDAFSQNPSNAVNGALWSIAYEFWCYIGVAVLGAVGILRRPWTIILLLISIMLIKAGLDVTGRKPGLGILGEIIGWPYLWTSMAPSFLIGVVALKFGHLIPRSRWILAALIFSTVVIAHITEDRVAFDLLFIPTLGYSVFYAAFSDAIIPDAAAFGDFSFGTYLYGFPIQQMIKSAFPITFSAYIALCLVLSLIAGVVSWFAVERRFVQTVTFKRTAKDTKLGAAHDAGPSNH